MTTLMIDRRGQLLQTPRFLDAVGARERNPGRLAVFVVLGAALALLAILVAVLVVMSLSAAVMAAHGQTIGAALQTLVHEDRPGRSLSSYAYEFATAGLGLFGAAAALIALAARLYRRPMLSFVTAAPRFRWRLAGLGLVVALPIILAALLAELLWAHTPLEWPILHGAGALDVAAYVGSAVVFLFLAALAEEMVFRGWLLQQTSAFTRNLVIILAVNGVLFSLIHLDPDPGAFMVRAMMGAGWAWIALRLGGLEFGAGAHLANNLVVSLLVKPLTFAPSAAERPDYRSVLVQLVIVLLTIAAVEWIARHRKLEVER